MNCYSAERSFKKKKQIKSLQTYCSNSIHISGETFFGKQLVALRLARKNLERRTRVRAEANRELALGITYLYFRFNYPRSSFQTRVKRTISSFVVTCRARETAHPPGIDNLIGLFFFICLIGARNRSSEKRRGREARRVRNRLDNEEEEDECDEDSSKTHRQWHSRPTRRMSRELSIVFR